MRIAAASTFLIPDASFASVIATVLAVVLLTTFGVFIFRYLARR